MPINNFKLFDEKKANMMSDDDYAINQQRLNGVQSGVASSQLQNKTLYQTALMCYALAQLMAANGYDANDANAVSTFVNNLSRSVLQKVVDKASANDVANQVAGKWVDAKQLGELKTDVADNYLSLLGGTMLGDLILHSDPTQSLQAATKQYVDNVIQIGTYKGNGATGTKKQSITFRKNPKFVLILTYKSGNYGVFGMFYIQGINKALVPKSGALSNNNPSSFINVNVSNGVFSWDVVHDEVGFNFKGNEYHYIGIL